MIMSSWAPQALETQISSTRRVFLRDIGASVEPLSSLVKSGQVWIYERFQEFGGVVN